MTRWHLLRLRLRIFLRRFIFIRTFKYELRDGTFRGMWIRRLKFLLRPRKADDKYGENGFGGFVIPIGNSTLIIVRHGYC